MLHASDLLDLSHTLARPLFEKVTYPWQVLPEIGEFVRALGVKLSPDEYDSPAPLVWIHKSALVAPSASITGPCIVGPEAEVRHCAFIRGNVLIGAGAVVGNSTELKNAILFDGVQASHYNYVGDSILGYKAHLGAGAITSNIKGDKSPVVVKNAGELMETGLRKFGAVVGDFVEVGCNAVLNPGTVIGRMSMVYPLTCVRGVVPPRSIVKNTGEIVPKRD
ncbi:MAG TPA: UDP-N-acetylglucosamine pyrophosphorylase [Papillibacter sp.]|jgi:NDP-sugar pyrophosphorylase family protein|nr:UDP-N-acetylglucosamine pyrophosphorylase [Papillibacter sp.]